MKTRIMRKSRGSQRGFTLIELLVVVLIIGILAAIAIPQYFKVVERATATEIVQDTGDIWAAEQRYNASNGQFIANFSNLDVQLINTAGSAAGTVMSGAGGTLTHYTVALGGGAGAALTIAWTRTGTPPAAFGTYTLTYTCTTPGVACTVAETNCKTSGQCLSLVQ